MEAYTKVLVIYDLGLLKNDKTKNKEAL